MIYAWNHTEVKQYQMQVIKDWKKTPDIFFSSVKYLP